LSFFKQRADKHNFYSSVDWTFSFTSKTLNISILSYFVIILCLYFLAALFLKKKEAVMFVSKATADDAAARVWNHVPAVRHSTTVR
jgi:hypothetical protein